MTVDNREKFQEKYLAGKLALEQGQYRLSIEYLEAALELTAPNSRQGGEAQIWLTTAYQAANRLNEAISLGEKLLTHPSLRIREQAQRIVYIMKAPKLERPKEWMSEIPNLADTEQGRSRYVSAKKQTDKTPREIELEDLEPPPTETKDGQFTVFAFFMVILILGSLVWMSRG